MHQPLINNTALGKFHNRDIQAFFVDAGRVSAKTTPTDIYNMGGAGKEPYKSALVKGRGDHGDIMQMAGAFPWIISDVDVAGIDPFRTDVIDEMADRVEAVLLSIGLIENIRALLRAKN